MYEECDVYTRDSGLSLESWLHLTAADYHAFIRVRTGCAWVSSGGGGGGGGVRKGRKEGVLEGGSEVGGWRHCINTTKDIAWKTKAKRQIFSLGYDR